MFMILFCQVSYASSDDEEESFVGTNLRRVSNGLAFDMSLSEETSIENLFDPPVKRESQETSDSDYMQETLNGFNYMPKRNSESRIAPEVDYLLKCLNEEAAARKHRQEAEQNRLPSPTSPQQKPRARVVSSKFLSRISSEPLQNELSPRLDSSGSPRSDSDTADSPRSSGTLGSPRSGNVASTKDSPRPLLDRLLINIGSKKTSPRKKE